MAHYFSDDAAPIFAADVTRMPPADDANIDARRRYFYAARLPHTPFRAVIYACHVIHAQSHATIAAAAHAVCLPPPVCHNHATLSRRRYVRFRSTFRRQFTLRLRATSSAALMFFAPRLRRAFLRPILRAEEIQMNARCCREIAQPSELAMPPITPAATYRAV
jgi:hypothetical protein